MQPGGRKSKGVYFLANDDVYDLALAFLNSFRRHNSQTNACLIPFDGNIERLAELSEVHRFTIFSRQDVLERCDEISRSFHGSPAGHYRKLAAWEGPYDDFIYIDVDTIVLADVEQFFHFLAEFGFVASHARMKGLQRWVWKESIASTGLLSEY